MSVLMALKDYRRTIYFLVLGLMLYSIVSMFLSVKAAKVSFYWAFYLSVLGIGYDFQRLQRHYWWVLAPLLLLGASDLIWFGWHYIGNPAWDEFNAYLATGKRLLLTAVIGYYLFSVMHRYAAPTRQAVRYALVAAFLLATAVGFWQDAHGVDRIDFFLGRATNAAYDYSILCAALIFLLLYEAVNRLTLVASLLIFVFSYYIIFQTGTRNVMATYPLIILFVGAIKLRHVGWKPLLMVLVSIAVVAALSWQTVIKPKMDETISEFQRFENTNGNQQGSLTSRLAMWRIGVNLIADHPLGNSLEQRWQYAENYVKTRHADQSALDYVNVHLHNELIEVGSLMGVPGAMVLLFFYFSLLFYARVQHNPPLFAAVLGLMICGLTDVIFASREQTIMLTLLIIALVAWHQPPSRTPAPSRH
ncbi:O-antigen ligase [Pantoea sp. 1.19]|uniref:O-antigen ligase family protein n=1 Tax=Pantoea sp. 1.19 TaxID=1925589 RepID=UPI00094904C5|nr:O-antigen ligase family protein [Pantoea sp. 1.19]